MNDEKQALILLGRIEGQLQAQAQSARDLMASIESMKKEIGHRLDAHGDRIRDLELQQAKATRHGAWGGTAAGGVIVAAIEIARTLLRGN